MGGEVWYLTAVIAIAILGGIRAEDSGVNDSTAMMFPPCNANDSCTFCTTIKILEEFNSTISRPLQDATNVICLDTTQQPLESTYELLGCPIEGYFSTSQSTDGICYVDTQNRRNLLLRPSNMVTGLHPFICLLGSDSLYSYAIALNGQGNDMVLFTDVRVYRNVEDNDNDPIILATATETVNVIVKEGDELTIVARVVTSTGSIIQAIANSPLNGENATDRLTTPDTGILCNNNENDFSGRGRYHLYSLQATMDDDQTMIRIFINFTGTNDTITIGQVNITVHENPSPPGSTTGTPMPTALPSEKEEEDDGSATTIILGVVIPLLVIILVIVIVIAVLIVVQRRRNRATIESTDSAKPQAPVGDGQNMNQLKVLVYACGDHPIDLLLSKLRQNDDKFRIEELTMTPSFLYNEYISKVSMELNVGTVLVDCSCPGQAHGDLHKAVKYFTLKPFGSNESSNWRVLRLIHTDGEIDSRSWSPLFDHVEVMYYGELNDEVVDAIVNKLVQYVPPSRTSSTSIGSRKGDERLLEAKRKREQEEFAKTIITEFKVTGDRVIKHVDKKSQETHNKLDVVDENVGLVQAQQSLMMEDNIRRQKEEGVVEQHNEEN